MLTNSRTTVKTLTQKQKQVLAYIQRRVQRDGMPPTHNEIMQELGLKSPFGVRQHLRLIGSKGHIDILPGKSRGIRLRGQIVDRRFGIRNIPIVGRIAAGQPILADEHLDGTIEVSDGLFPGGELFALRVQGSSMIKVGINDGDLAVIRQQPGVENGQIAAVQRNDEATLKRWHAFGDYVCLRAENDDVAEIRVERGAALGLRVLGLYVGLIRQAR